ncbi:MAG: hypothetical protein FWH21_03810 [Kiritimatiellaeota bacterium]|nr:hypothetical protein [Kiritimatiellota bacterium]
MSNRRQRTKAPEVRDVSNRRWSEVRGTQPSRERNRRTVPSTISAPAGAERPALFNPCRGWARGDCLSAGSALAPLALHRRLLTLNASGVFVSGW